MKLPTYQPHARFGAGEGYVAGSSGVSLQGCNWFACAAAVAQCIAKPDPISCIMTIAPNCRDCL